MSNTNKAIAVNFASLTTDAAITAAIEDVHQRGESLQLDIQTLIVAVAVRWATTGDVREPVKHINALLHKNMLRGMRKNALRAYVELYFGFVFNEETKQLVAGKKSHHELDIKAMGQERWWELTPEPEYKPIADFSAEIDRLIKRATTDRQKMGEQSAVSEEMLAKLTALKVTSA